MIPALTLIVAVYVTVRLAVIIDEYEGMANGNTAIRALAWVALIVTIAATAYVFVQAREASEQVEQARRMLEGFRP